MMFLNTVHNSLGVCLILVSLCVDLLKTHPSFSPFFISIYPLRNYGEKGKDKPINVDYIINAKRYYIL